MHDQLENAEEFVVIHNPEQVEIMQTLERLRDDFATAAAEVEREAPDNESLYLQAQDLDWTTFTCARAERWIDNSGAMGWRAYATALSPNNVPGDMVVIHAHAPRILAAVASKLANMGWDGIEVVPA